MKTNWNWWGGLLLVWLWLFILTASRRRHFPFSLLLSREQTHTHILGWCTLNVTKHFNVTILTSLVWKFDDISRWCVRRDMNISSHDVILTITTKRYSKVYSIHHTMRTNDVDYSIFNFAKKNCVRLFHFSICVVDATRSYFPIHHCYFPPTSLI